MTIDWWTLGIQVVNVVILVWLLGRFFWRPVAGMIAERRATAQRMLADAEAKRTEATAALAEIEGTRAGLAREREASLAAAHEAAQRARAVALAEVEKEVASLRVAAKAALASERATADRAWVERASHLAVEIARRLTARLDGPAVREAFLNWLLDEIRKLPAQERTSMATNGVALEAISAAPLSPSDQDRYRALIGEAFGASPAIDFKTDPALIAGLELRGPHFAVSNSWQADLARILTDLTHDSRS